MVTGTTCCVRSNENKALSNTTVEEIINSNFSEEEVAAIRKPLDMYVNAAIEGSSEVARGAFAEGATISHAENDSLICLPISVLFEFYDTVGKQNASYEISELSVAGDGAMVRSESVFGNAAFTDMLAMVKDGGEWKIVSKIFQAK